MSEPRPTPTGPKCPTCGSIATIPIMYGLPGHEMRERAEQGEIALGGCVISEDAPQWVCTTCGTPFNREEQPTRPGMA